MYQCKSVIAYALWYSLCPYCDEIIAIEDDVFQGNDNIVCICDNCKKRIHVEKQE